MRVCLTGATGFIGSHVALDLLSRGTEVHALIRAASSTSRLERIIGDLDVSHGDLSGRTSAEWVGRVRPDVVVHSAWYQRSDYLESPANIETLRSTLSLIEASFAAGCSRFVLLGSGLEGATDPGTPGGSLYATTKRAAHLVAEALFRPPRTWACAHIYYVYGPEEDPQRLVPSLINGALRGEPLDLRHPRTERDYMHVEDVASAVGLLTGVDAAGPIDICTGRTESLRTIQKMIGLSVGSWPDPDVSEAVPDLGFPVTGDPTRLQALGWKPKYSLQDGLRQTIEWRKGKIGPR